jgi:hypothetical protein
MRGWAALHGGMSAGMSSERSQHTQNPPSQGQNLKVLEQQEQRQRLGEWIICDFLVVEVFSADCVHARVVAKAPLPRQGMPMSTSMLTPAAMQLPLLGRNQ